jgi:hypothetical protein
MEDRNSNYGTISNNDKGDCADDGQSEEDNCDEKDLLIRRDAESEDDGDCADHGENDEDDYEEEELLIRRGATSNGGHAYLGDRKLKGNSALGLDVNADDDPDFDSLKSDETLMSFIETEDATEIGEDNSNTINDSAEDMEKMTSASEPDQVSAVTGDEETTEGNYLPSNPFGDEDNDDSDGLDTPAKLTVRSAQPSNPFGDDDDDDGPEMKEDLKQNVHKSPPIKPTRVKKPFNPFDDGEIDAVGSVAVEKILHRRRVVTESLAPVTVASMCNGRDRSPSLSQFEVPTKKYCKEYQELMNLGFDRVCVGNALQKSSGDVAIAMKMLTSRLFDDHVMSNDQLYVWKSPLLLRIGK